MSTLDWRGVLERAGADAAAPEGSQSWALAHVEAAVSELADAARDIPVPYDYHGEPETPEWARFVAALARVQGGAA